MTEIRPPARVLALDIGNVCLNVEMDQFVANLGFDSADAFVHDPRGAALYQVGCAFERGEMDTHEFLTRLSNELPNPVTIEEAHKIASSIIGPQLTGIAEVVALAKANNIQVVFLSDIGPLHYELVHETLDFLDDVDGAVLSYKVGQQKPHDDMYIAMEEEFCGGRPPLLFADDKLCNIEAAQNRGWNAYQVGCHNELLESLQQAIDAL
ncbi:hypothetical protein BVY04_00810 [bacterium M21]|nr:hypothetical protein BVY04_00810 [bacterium M21]